MKDTGINKNPKGKLYSKYYNSMRTLKACGLIPVKKLPVKTISHNRYDQQEFGNIYILILLLYRVYQIVCDSMI